MREIHMVRTMKIIICIERTIGMLLGRPKNLFPLKVWSAIKEGRSKHEICHNSH
jgi:hypothetical protein